MAFTRVSLGKKILQGKTGPSVYCGGFLVSSFSYRFEDLYNARLAYQAYEASDMKGMVIEQHRILRTLKVLHKYIQIRNAVGVVGENYASIVGCFFEVSMVR